MSALELGAPAPDQNVDPALLAQAETLAGESAEIPAGVGRPADRPAEASADFTADARELLEFVYEGVRAPYPGLERVYTPDVRGRLADRLGAVMKKRNLTFAALFGKWAPEISLAMCTLPLVPPTLQVIREQRAADRAAAEKAKATPPAGASA